MTNTTTVKKTRGRPVKAHGTERPTRIPMSGSRKRMHVDPDLFPDFHIAWINDNKDLVYRAKRAGYEHVMVDEIPGWGNSDPDSGSPTDSMVSMKVGASMVAYLMKLPIELWEEDQQTKREENEARTSSMKQELNSGKEGTYGQVEIS